MPTPQAKALHVSPFQQELLQRLIHRTTSAQRLVKRGHIILEAAEGTSNTKIAEHQQVDYETVRRWRDRWYAAQARLEAIEATGKPKLLSQAIEVLLTDEQRPGVPATFTFEQFMQIMVLACETVLATWDIRSQNRWICSFFLELWHSLMKGCKRISCV